MPSRAQLAMIHIARKGLALPEDHYRAALGRFGVASSRDLSEQQADQLIDFFVGLGWQPVSKAPGKSPDKPPVSEREKYRRKIYALLRDSNRLGGDDDPFAYANGIAKKMFFRHEPNVVIRVEQCDEVQLRKVVQALQYQARRGGG